MDESPSGEHARWRVVGFDVLRVVVPILLGVLALGLALGSSRAIQIATLAGAVGGFLAGWGASRLPALDESTANKVWWVLPVAIGLSTLWSPDGLVPILMAFTATLTATALTIRRRQLRE